MHIENKFNLFRRLTILSFTSLLLLLVYWNITLGKGVNLPLLFIQCAPLLALTPGLVSRYYRAYSWLCFVTLLYFVVSVQGALSSNASWSNYVFVTLTVLLFIASMMCSRYAQRVQKSWAPDKINLAD